MKKGTHHSEEAKERMRLSQKKIGNSPPSRLGIPNTEEQKEKIRATLKKIGHKPPCQYGNNNPSKKKKVREKISNALKGRKFSIQHKKSLSENHFKTHTLKTRKKMSVAHKKNVKKRLWPWNEGTTQLALKIRRSFEYRLWRSDVFTRDNFICQECCQKGGKLEAHHKKPFALILKLNEIKTFEEAICCEELWNINNGITLCKECHRKRR